jgi:beta-lactamase class A
MGQVNLRRGWTAAVAAVLITVPLISFLAPPAAASPAVCASSSHAALAARIGRDILAAERGRVSFVAVAVDDPGLGLACRLNSTLQFYSASVVKATILGALLHKAQDQRRSLTSRENALAGAMITRSDNNAASALWADVGRFYLQHFLNLAGMTHTVLGPGRVWGLTLITASDEILLLRLLLRANAVLSTASRNYELNLMAHVIASQRWGVPAGAPTSLTVHVKNGWLPLARHGWHVHSIGCFTGRGGGYSIVVLTLDNPSMRYGITTIEAIARAINRDLNPAATARIPPSPVSPSWEIPDEQVPAGS